MVRELIRREFGVRLSVVSVGRLLAKLGLSPQRPLWRAYQQNPEAVERWKREQFPAIREQAAEAGATIWFADEAGVRSDYHAGTTWAPVGRTPVVRTAGALRFGVRGHVHLRDVHRLLQAAAARHRPPGVPRRRRSPDPPLPRGAGVRRRHERPAAAVPAAGLLAGAQPRRVGLEERQGRPHRPRRCHRARRPQGQGPVRAAPAAETPPPHPRFLPRPESLLHHRLVVHLLTISLVLHHGLYWQVWEVSFPQYVEWDLARRCTQLAATVGPTDQSAL